MLALSSRGGRESAKSLLVRRAAASLPISFNGLDLLSSSSTHPRRSFHLSSLSSAAERPNGYLHESTIPTLHFQKSLPRLPIPPLEKTLDRYLASVEVVTSPVQFAVVKKDVEEFKNGVGPSLHEALIQKDKLNKHTSYINKWWFEKYVQDRAPLPINYNPAIMWKRDPNEAKNDQAQRAASLIASSVRFFRTFRDRKLIPDIYHVKPQKSKTKLYDNICRLLPESISFYGSYMFDAYPLDMSQYKNLFASTRIPKIGRDELQVYPNARHVVVQRGADFYTFNVLHEDGTAVPDEEIFDNIQAILKQPYTDASKGSPVGLFTSLNRDEWAKIRDSLISESNVNRAAFQLVDSALMSVVLDEASPTTNLELFNTFLTGDGTNRWYDKSFQAIICKNGEAGVNFEHSWGDGVAVLRYMNETFDDSVNSAPLLSAAPVQPRKIVWELSAQQQSELKRAHQKLKDFIGTMKVNIVDERKVDRSIAKRYGVGTDGFMQMAIQLGHWKMHGRIVSTYESASTAAFKHGRTEVIRSATMKAKQFVETMSNPAASSEEKAGALRAAIDLHQKLVREAVMGHGFDRHLLGLQELAKERDIMPSLFTNEGKQIMDKIILSTSTLSSHALQGGGFGPVNDLCYGIGYGIEDAVRFAVTTFRPDGEEFADKLREAVREMADVLEASQKTKQMP